MGERRKRGVCWGERGAPDGSCSKPQTLPPFSSLHVPWAATGHREYPGKIPSWGIQPGLQHQLHGGFKNEVEIPASRELATQRVDWFQLLASKQLGKEGNLGLVTCVSYIPSCAHVCTQKCRVIATAPLPWLRKDSVFGCGWLLPKHCLPNIIPFRKPSS